MSNCIIILSVGSMVFGTVIFLFTIKSHHLGFCGKPCVTFSLSEYFKLCFDSSVFKDAFLRHQVMCGVAGVIFAFYR